MPRSKLIKDTTREERMRIVAEGLDWCGDSSCDQCSGCSLGVGAIDKMYQPYIDGEKEIREITAEYSAPFVRG
jgi:NADH:ubiquinone oxidoreductase subunit F (NADH-binding)